MGDQPRILHADEAVLVIEKPAGWPAVPMEGGIERTLAAWIVEQFPVQKSIGPKAEEAGLCHRLDNDTSGLLVAARTDEVYRRLRQQFDEGAVRKEYAALVLGRPPSDGTIDLPIAHHPRKKKKMVVCSSELQAKEWKARPARTAFEMQARYRFEAKGVPAIEYALLFVTITTGVRHQIRAHLASVGHPIAGDRLYQNPRMRSADALPLMRQFLHATRIAFLHPASGTEVVFSSSLPDDLETALAQLRKH